jgi:micrococcal nuclease
MSMTARAALSRVAAVAAALLLHWPAVHALVVQGIVTHVVDGDSLWVRPAPGAAALEVRLQGIDAPEICQHFGTQARDALAALVLHRRVTLTTRSRDRYQRTLARISVGSQDVGAWMVARGYAWSNGWRDSGGPYAQQQAQARAARLGLWGSGRGMAPREFRKRHGSCH